MEGVDAEFYRSLKWILDNDITDILDLTFSTEEEIFGERVEVDLKPDGKNIEVTEENKHEYVELITEWRISKRVEEQFKAFIDGFNELIPQELVNVFDERELELLIGGLAEIDTVDWKKHTDYRGYQELDQVIQWFWKCINEWDSEQKLVCYNLPLVLHVYRSMVSRICKVVMVQEDSQLRKLVSLTNCPSHIHVSIELICHHMLTMKV